MNTNEIAEIYHEAVVVTENTVIKDIAKWTVFWDMSSGGSTKLKPYDMIYIQATEDNAIKIFEDIFDRDPYNVTCDCCGQDYSIDEYSSLEQATGYHRNCLYDSKLKGYAENLSNGYGKYMTVEEYESKSNVLILRKTDSRMITYYQRLLE